MTSPSSEPAIGADELAAAVASITEVLIAVASGNFEARAPRSHRGDVVDALAFMVNATAEEVSELVRTLEAEREQLRRTRDQLVLAEKLAALGELSAGVAHELNQPLTVIRMTTELLARKPNATIEQCARDLGMMSEASRRMGRIVDSVQAFASGRALRMEPMAPLAPVEDALILLDESLRRAAIRVERVFEPDLPRIVGDSDRLQQVFVNLLVNARHAIEAVPPPGSSGVRIAVRATESIVEYRVEDDGVGVLPEHAARIFDPFFTTKPAGSGTGLGLSVSHGIALDHGGILRHEPRAPRGACFVLELPRAPVRRPS